jgi:transcriptional antiterminator RfaH
MHWYVIRTKPHQEGRAQSHLTQLPVETFLPLLKHTKMIRRQVKTVLEPLFHGYLFARFDIGHRYRAVNFATGVLNIVEFGSQPAAVSDSTIDEIRNRLVDGYVVLKSMPFQPGQPVQVNGGPLAGLEAIFIRAMTKQHRVLLLLNTLRTQAKLAIDTDQVSCMAQELVSWQKPESVMRVCQA